MTVMFLLSVAMAVVLVKEGQPLQPLGLTCQGSLAPPTDARGVNRLARDSNIPLFQLAVASKKQASVSLDQSKTYKVEVSAVNEQFHFSEARISLSAMSSCGTGSLTFDPHHFIDAKQSGSTCPRLVLTNRKLPMVEIPSLSWKPPGCGCVQIRAVIISLDNVYYSDNEEVENGPLAQTICVHQKTPREMYLSALCQVQERHSTAEIISRSSFLQRHQVEVKWMDKHGLEMGLELRKSDNKICCNKYSHEDKLTCFDDSRRRRVDRFCEDGYPDLPLTHFRRKHMRDREKECCFLLGEHRYSCFAEDNDLNQGPGVTVLDFSQDETDPVNDLAEFASAEDADVIKSIEAIAAKAKKSHDDSVEDKKGDRGDKDKDDDDTEDDEKKDGITDEQTDRKIPTSKLFGDNAGVKAPVEGYGGSTSMEFHAMQAPGHNQEKASNTRVDQEYGNPILTRSETLKKRNRGGSSREDKAPGRRAGSWERTDKKRANDQRPKPASAVSPWFPGNVGVNPRDAGLSRETTSSAETRAGIRTSAQKRDDWLEAVDEPGFEDQGGKSVDETLDILQTKMGRIQIKHQCCQAGAMAGGSVYGGRVPAEKECDHSREKYMAVLEFQSGKKSCISHFLKCCIEQSVSGPAGSSSEFNDKFKTSSGELRDKLRPSSGELRDKLRPSSGELRDKLRPSSRELRDKLRPSSRELRDKLRPSSRELRDKLKPSSNSKKTRLNERRDDLESPAGLEREEIPEDIPGLESPDAYESSSERRFQSMREVDQTPPENDEDEINGPRKFDETDNDLGGQFDILDRKDKIEDEIDNDNDDVDNEDAYDGDEGKEDILIARKKHRTEDHHRMGSKNKKEVAIDQLDRGNDPMDSLDKQDSGVRRPNKGLLLARTSGGRSRNTYNPAGGRSRGTRYSSRESGQQTPRGSRQQTSKGSRQQTSRESRQRTSRESRQRTSRESRQRTSRESRERRKKADAYYNNYRSYKVIPSGKIGTQDSREMASAHAKKFVANLDSKEMTDAYRKTAPEQTDVFNDEPKRRSPKKKKHTRQRRRF